MSTPAPQTLMQRTETVPTAAGPITVRRMYHKPAREFLRKLASILRERGGQIGRDSTGGLALASLDALPDIVAEADGLAEHLVLHSTDDAAAVEELSLAEWLHVLAAALRPAVEAAVAAADQEVQDAWHYATTIRRDHPLLASMATQLGLTEAQIDALFRAAATL